MEKELRFLGALILNLLNTLLQRQLRPLMTALARRYLNQTHPESLTKRKSMKHAITQRKEKKYAYSRG